MTTIEQRIKQLERRVNRYRWGVHARLLPSLLLLMVGLSLVLHPSCSKKTPTEPGDDWPAGYVHCGGIETEVVPVTNPATGQTWMDRNLGASRAATSSTDEEAYGDLYQWGRFADGHQCRNSSTTSTLSSTAKPGHGQFILNPNYPWDWRSPQHTDLWQGVILWQGVNGVNNPCPAGYRLPTQAELADERASWSSDDADGAFASPLKWSAAGCRLGSDGSLEYLADPYGFYWSSAGVEGTHAWCLELGIGEADEHPNVRTHGFSIRCLKQ